MINEKTELTKKITERKLQLNISLKEEKGKLYE